MISLQLVQFYTYKNKNIHLKKLNVQRILKNHYSILDIFYRNLNNIIISVAHFTICHIKYYLYIRLYAH